MKPPGKTTLFRMQETAQLEVNRIEIGQDLRLRAGEIKVAMPDQVRKRDDFAGIVRLIDVILSDKELIDRVKSRMGAVTVLATDVDVEVAE